MEWELVWAVPVLASVSELGSASEWGLGSEPALEVQVSALNKSADRPCTTASPSAAGKRTNSSDPGCFEGCT
jgi:hypothetical protein